MHFNQCIEIAVEKLQDKIQFPNPEAREALKVYIRCNLLSIARTKLKKEDIAVIKSIPLLQVPDFFQVDPKITQILGLKNTSDQFQSYLIQKAFEEKLGNLSDFVNKTGIRIGALSGREKIFNFMNLHELIEEAHQPGVTEEQAKIVDYSVKGPNTIYFKDKDTILHSKAFENFMRKCIEKGEQIPHFLALGKSTSDLLKGLLTEVSVEKWTELNSNPQMRQIVQAALFRLMNHLSMAELHMDDYVKFTNSIELVHCEIATLLSIMAPFKPNDFETIYKNELDLIPEGLNTMVNAGLTKSAMNTFSGLLGEICKTNPDMHCAHGPLSYFESAILIGNKRTLQNVIQDPSVKSVDLYVSEFNHNITIDLNHDEYKGGKIIDEVDAILLAKPQTQHLTVAVDCTIDYIHSEKVKKLLEHFEVEIKSGKLNFVFFRSGQKFEMLGMDNYYGSPFYIVNNGDKHWEQFNSFNQKEIFRTDPLSQQWFCLVYKYAPKALEGYRGQIFENAKQILKRVPEKLKPGNNPYIKVCTVAGGDNAMDTCFIDIKILEEYPQGTEMKLEKMFAKKFTENGLKFHARGSFGFYHANLNVIIALQDKQPRNVRINPGLNPKEVDLIVEVLNDIVKEIVEVNEKNASIAKL